MKKTLAGLMVLGAIANTATAQPVAHRIPNKAIAPEVCQDNGKVYSVWKRGRLLYVHCSDGVVELLSTVPHIIHTP